MKLLQSGGSWLRILVVFAAAILILGFGAARARAAWQLFDSFETNPAATWFFEHPGSGGGVFETAGQYSRTGTNDAYIYVSSSFSSVGRTVILAPFFPGRTLYSIASIYLRPYGTNVTVNFEVIDPSNWTYISLKTVTLSNSYTYQLVTTDMFIPYRQDVYVRVSVLAGTAGSVGVDVDDLMVQAETSPAYEPWYWNDGSTIQRNNNCYNYSNNRRTDTFAQPGTASGRPYTQITAAEVSAGATSDGLEPTNAWATSPTGKTKIALVIWPGVDYHWYRLDRDGRWSHKPGGSTATNVDSSGALIYSPETANRGSYTQFVGYFFTPSDPVQGQGHANIR